MEVRVVATRALGRVGGARAATTLLKSLAHPHPLPEGIVAMALLDVGAEAIPSLSETLRSDSAAQRSMAAEALGPLEAVAAWRDIAALLDDVDVRVRVNAVRALGQLGVPDAGDAVARCLEPAGPAALRAEAACALGQIGADRYVPLLVTGVENRDHSVAHNSAEALTKAGDAGYRALLMLAAGRAMDPITHGRHSRTPISGRCAGTPISRPICRCDRMTGALATVIRGFAWFALAYFLVLNTWYLGLVIVAALETIGTARRAPFAGHDEIFQSALAPPITVVVPARNEAATIVACVRGLLHLRYPVHEVVVIEDGSTDDTFERLREAFDLVDIPRVIRNDVPIIGRINSTHAPRNRENLVVVRKDSIGRPADAVNVGINVARYPLICRVDADSYLDRDALLAAIKPFIEDPQLVVAVGGTIRVANGSTVEDGRIVDARMPSGWLARIQTVEYLRAFLLGRVGWSRMRGMLFVSGAFGLFRRDVLVEIGGCDVVSEGDDLELVTRLHHQFRRARRRYRLSFVAEPCCWTHVPTTRAVLARQRRRWAQTLAETLWIHREMICNPRFGLMGLVVLPYYVVFEMLGAIVELVALPMFAIGLAIGIIDPNLALLFVIFGIGYAAFLSIVALAVEEFSYHRYTNWHDLGVALIAAIVENVGYRQMYVWWRIRGLVNAFRRRPAVWLRPPVTPTASTTSSVSASTT